MKTGLANAIAFAGASQDFETPRAAIANWLLHANVQREGGRESGAVVGWIDAEGGAKYVYPEITGYYLQWLSWIVARRGFNSRLVARAAAAQDWLGSWLEREPLPTRIYLTDQEPDWRNDAVFFFDLAMVLRGLASAATLRLIKPDTGVLERLSAVLTRLIASDGMFEACLAHDPQFQIAERWSSRRGGFIAKAAAGVMTAVRALRLAPELAEAAEATFNSSVQHALWHPPENTHAFLYAAEGILNLPTHARFAASLSPLGVRCEDLLDRICGVVGGRESLIGGNVERIDVVAQALRVGILLEVHNPRFRLQGSIRSTLLQFLLTQIRSDGGLPFSPGQSNPAFNTWTAMFAEQALTLAQSSPTELSHLAKDLCLV